MDALSFGEVEQKERIEVDDSRTFRLAHHIVAVLDADAERSLESAQTSAKLTDTLLSSWSQARWDDTISRDDFRKCVYRADEDRSALLKLLRNGLRSTPSRGTYIRKSMGWALDVLDPPRLGLAFSGGGIRSATFNLGILQQLAEDGILHCVDYLSTVSGGGYIGSWFLAWLKSVPFAQVETDLKPEWSTTPANSFTAPREVEFLREYSNYLTPQVGLLTVDTWTMVAIYLRNTLLNLLILIPGLAVLLLIPYAVLKLANYLASRNDPCHFLVWFSLLALLISTLILGLNLKWFDSNGENAGPPYATALARQKWIQWLIVLPVFLAAYSVTCWFTHFVTSSLASKWDYSAAVWEASARVGLSTTLLLAVLELTGGFRHCFVTNVSHSRQVAERRLSIRAIWALIWRPVVAGFFGGTLLMRGSLGLLYHLARSPAGSSQDVCDMFFLGSSMWGVPILIEFVLAAVVIIDIGLMGRNLPDDRREWLGRLGGWLIICSLCWVGVFGVSIYGPKLVLAGLIGLKRYLTSALVLGWAGTTIKGVLAGTGSKTTDPRAMGSEKLTPAEAVIVKASPYVFIGGLLLGLSVALHLLLIHFSRGIGDDTVQNLVNDHWKVVGDAVTSWWPLLFIVVCAAVAGGLSWFVDINEFSMHHFYKNRLVRCYLGASNPQRKPNPFTGFDERDDVHLADLVTTRGFVGPYPIVNSTLNLVHGEELAWQERKAESFVLTPKYSGFEVHQTQADVAIQQRQPKLDANGFRPTAEYAYPRGVHLGTAVAISGAAANPNMGVDSSPALSFLMTVFNVRLGWWLGNPRWETKWRRSSPTCGLSYLVKELFGLTDDRTGFVDLSDGGHFENLGIYELVRRRCRFIIACDAEEDAQFSFGGLGNAIRKCRTDFGTDIQIDVSRIRRDPVSFRSQSHCVVGTIIYNDGTEGKLLYLKASLTGDEPTDLLEYDAREPAFPHQSTADQWFDESQFESYRKLGIHVAETTFSPVSRDKTLNGTKKDFFDALKDAWCPPSSAIEKSFTKHAEAYETLMERLRKDPELAFLDRRLFPGFNSVLNKPPRTDAELRSGFYFCNSLIQLMENVYVDLKLQSESERNHPYNQGWIELFRGWATSPALIQTWKVSGKTYGTLFRKFCEQELGLRS